MEMLFIPVDGGWRKWGLLISLGTLVLLMGTAHGQEANPAEARLREALRQLTTRVQTAESEAATLKATQAAAEAKNQTLQAQVEKLTKDAATNQAVSDKALSAVEAKLAERTLELERTKEALEKWKAAHAKITEAARKIETVRADLAIKAASLENRVADLTRRNLALWKLGDEVLTRLENFAYGTAIAAREPFVGQTRVRLENEVQGYKDKLLDPKLKP